MEKRGRIRRMEKVVLEKEEVVLVSEQCSDSVKVKSGKGFSEAVKEIQILFERASESGNPILELLDVGKLRYHRKFDLNPVLFELNAWNLHCLYGEWDLRVKKFVVTEISLLL
ncbi:hypothetical protein V8G54_005905 [Vigna mungo]|uniref:DUF632 domain-containing protein n=1 Tax=Vigna mungo TaxID=3915 RepID=A0AAQ3NZG7_VIGMU